MGTLFVGYLIGWAATSAYVGWLAVQNARLASRQNELRRIWEQQGRVDPSCAKAA
jgi:hypothetical protein